MQPVLFFIAVLLFVITIYHVKLMAVGGVYPSKYILKRRAMLSAGGGLLLILLALFI